MRRAPGIGEADEPRVSFSAFGSAAVHLVDQTLRPNQLHFASSLVTFVSMELDALWPRDCPPV